MTAFLLNSKRVNTAIKGLDSVRLQTVFSSDIKKNLGSLFSHRPPATCRPDMAKRFQTLATLEHQTLQSFKPNEKTFPPNNDAIASDALVRCLLNASKYDLREVKLHKLKASFTQASLPNLNAYYIDINSQVQISLHGGTTGAINFRFNFKHRVSIKSMEDYGIIFTRYNKTAPLFNSGTYRKISVFGKVAITNTTPRNLSFAHLTHRDKADVTYFSLIESQGEKLEVSNEIDSMIEQGSLSFNENFKQGIEFNSFRNKQGTPLVLPWNRYSNQYQDIFWYDLIRDIYILPKLDSRISVAKVGNSFYQYGQKQDGDIDLSLTVGDNQRNTAKIFQRLTGSPSDLVDTCKKPNPAIGKFHPLVFNHLNEDFIIDFSQNNTLGRPPIFCGAIAAKNLKIILNTNPSPELNKHYFIGKLIISGNIEIVGGMSNKEVIFLDSSRLTSSQIDGYVLPDDATVDDVASSLFLQKFFLTQNFFLPLLEAAPVGGSASFYRPRSLKEFFNEPCGTSPTSTPPENGRCRSASIPSPERLAILEQKNLFYYEARNLD